jgi:hypothetical protein
MNLQDIAVWTIVGLTIAIFAWRMFRSRSTRKPGCGGGCDCGKKR